MPPDPQKNAKLKRSKSENIKIKCGKLIIFLPAAEVEQSGYEKHKAEMREQTAQVLGQQTPARVGEGKKKEKIQTNLYVCMHINNHYYI